MKCRKDGGAEQFLGEELTGFCGRLAALDCEVLLAFFAICVKLFLRENGVEQYLTGQFQCVVEEFVQTAKRYYSIVSVRRNLEVRTEVIEPFGYLSGGHGAAALAEHVQRCGGGKRHALI